MSKLRYMRYAPRSHPIEAVARIMDFGNTLTKYPKLHSGRKTDMLALRLDWTMVGQDIWQVIKGYERTSLKGVKPHG